jgi:asparagine synthase (glutamine-hydrolysing)
MNGEFLALSPVAKGNVALLDGASGLLFLAADWTGAFPLYYTCSPKGFLFSSHLRLLARVAKATLNLTSVVDQLQLSYQIGDSTIFKDVRRLQAGQSLRFDIRDQRFAIRESSKLWTGGELSIGLPDAADAATHLLAKSIERGLPPAERHALMMSAGWDSRTLLGSYLSSHRGENLLLYSHGALQSRELALVGELGKVAATPTIMKRMTGELLDHSVLSDLFQSTECGMHPHFYVAAKHVAGEYGIQNISTGVFGEILGGHYGVNMLYSKRSDLAAFQVSQLVGTGRLRRETRQISPDDFVQRLVPRVRPEQAAIFCEDVRRDFYVRFSTALRTEESQPRQSRDAGANL